MGTTFDIGDVIRVASTFTDTGGVKQDPTQVTYNTADPAGTVSTFTRVGATTGTVDSIVRGSSGAFYYDWLATSSGVHTYKVTSTGSYAGAGQGWFNVRRSRMTT